MNPKPLIVSLLLGLIGLSTVSAQQVTEKKSLTLDGAKRAIAAAVVEARKSAGTAAIAVVDDGGNLIAVARLDNTFAAGANISIGKARTAVIFKKPTKALEETVNKGRTAMATLDDFTPLQGGIPIIVDGQVIGGIGVSGAANAEQDEQVAIAGANAIANPSPLPVTFVPKEKVSATFARGGPLLDTTGLNYRVDASRRVEPGQVEIHLKDTDLIYVVSGEATFVTGGKAVETKQTGPNEIRGTKIEGGNPHTLSAGDVIVVPAGTPHWFSAVKSEFHYYIIKVS